MIVRFARYLRFFGFGCFQPCWLVSVYEAHQASYICCLWYIYNIIYILCNIMCIYLHIDVLNKIKDAISLVNVPFSRTFNVILADQLFLKQALLLGFFMNKFCICALKRAASIAFLISELRIASKALVFIVWWCRLGFVVMARVIFLKYQGLRFKL